MLQRTLEQVEPIGEIVCQVEKRFLHGFADQGVRGEVHDGLWPVHRQGCVDGAPVFEIALDKGGFRVDGGAVALVQVVEDHDLIPCQDQLFDCNAADVASASSDQYLHGVRSPLCAARCGAAANEMMLARRVFQRGRCFSISVADLASTPKLRRSRGMLRSGRSRLRRAQI